MSGESPSARLGPARLERGLAPCVFFISGAVALVHQVVWTRRMVDVLGASSSTFAQVVGAFFVGLALGGRVGGGPAAETGASLASGWRGRNRRGSPRITGAGFRGVG